MKFIDLFCGIGGFRMALDRVGAECVFSAEINRHACDVYEKNFGENPFCDVTDLNASSLPYFDLLCGGFPCQAFSIAGKKQGFNDARGTLFFDICRIAAEKKPKVLLLENVKNLVNHDGGKTFKTIQGLIADLGYDLSWEILSARDFGVPQHRERIILVAVRSDLNVMFDFNRVARNRIDSLAPFLEGEGDVLSECEYTILPLDKVKKQKSGLVFCGYRNKKMRVAGVLPDTEHLSRGHKQINRIYNAEGVHPTISSQETSGRYFILHNDIVRKLTLDECFKIMGFPPEFIKVGSKSNLYTRVGNSVCVPMIEEIAKEIKAQVFDVS